LEANTKGRETTRIAFLGELRGGRKILLNKDERLGEGQVATLMNGNMGRTRVVETVETRPSGRESSGRRNQDRDASFAKRSRIGRENLCREDVGKKTWGREKKKQIPTSR